MSIYYGLCEDEDGQPVGVTRTDVDVPVVPDTTGFNQALAEALALVADLMQAPEGGTAL